MQAALTSVLFMAPLQTGNPESPSATSAASAVSQRFKRWSNVMETGSPSWPAYAVSSFVLAVNLWKHVFRDTGIMHTMDKKWRVWQQAWVLTDLHGRMLQGWWVWL